MGSKLDLEIEQFKSGISTFIFAWMLHLNTTTGLDSERCSEQVVDWVRTFCDSLVEEQKLANTKETNND